MSRKPTKHALIVASFACGLAVVQVHADTADKYLACVDAADKRCGPDNCAACQEEVTCSGKFVAAMEAETEHIKNRAKAIKIVKEARDGDALIRKGVEEKGCTATLASASSAQTQQQGVICDSNDSTFSVDQRIGACAALIQSGHDTVQNRAIRYNNRGKAYREKGDLEHAIADLNEAIQLNPTFALAYYNRGIAYGDKGDFDRAIADYNQAIQLNPKDADAYNGRGIAYSGKGDLDHAIADYTHAIQLNPKDAPPHVYRGTANLFAGALPKALADFNQASELDPKDAYAALWLDIANRRSNLPSRLPEAIKQIDMTKWPAPMIRLYLGQLTPEAVLAAADDPDVTKKKGQVCGANFYSAELALQRGAKDEATRLFQLAVTGCSKTFIEYDAASAELKALGANPRRTEQ